MIQENVLLLHGGSFCSVFFNLRSQPTLHEVLAEAQCTGTDLTLNRKQKGYVVGERCFS